VVNRSIHTIFLTIGRYWWYNGIINNKEVSNGQAGCCAVGTGVAGNTRCFASDRNSAERYKEQDKITETTPPLPEEGGEEGG